MKAIAYIVGLLAVACNLQGCASKEPPPPVPIQPVTIKGDTFCRIMNQRLSWHPRDTRETIDGIRRLNAKWVARCGPQRTV